MLGFAAHLVAIGVFVAASSACSNSREPEVLIIGTSSTTLLWTSTTVANPTTTSEADVEQLTKSIKMLTEKVDDQAKVINDLTRNMAEENSKQDKEIDDLIQLTEGMDATVAPIGTIAAWLGSSFNLTLSHGWLLCNGSVILEGPLKGNTTPNLNGEERFLRGGLGYNVGTFQEDQIQDHDHSVSDPGHSHSDAGHSHGYYDQRRQSTHGVDNDKDKYSNYGNYDQSRTTSTAYASIRSSSSNVRVNGISSGNVGTETRPKNMIVEWIIRVL